MIRQCRPPQMGGLAERLEIDDHRDGRRANRRLAFASPLSLNAPAGPSESDGEAMETARITENARLLGEPREVFLSRMLVLVIEYLEREGSGGALSSVLDALEDDREAGLRKGRARPKGRL